MGGACSRVGEEKCLQSFNG